VFLSVKFSLEMSRFYMSVTCTCMGFGILKSAKC